LGEAGTGHAFAEAAFLDEGGLELADRLIEEVVGLVDEADEAIGHDLGRSGV
jgi:hypothetical protein